MNFNQLSEDQRVECQAEAVAETITDWQKNRQSQLEEICNFVDLDKINVEIENGQFKINPKVTETDEEIAGYYQDFVKDFLNNFISILNSEKTKDKNQDDEKLIDFLVKLIKER